MSLFHLFDSSDFIKFPFGIIRKVFQTIYTEKAKTLERIQFQVQKQYLNRSIDQLVMK